MKPLMAIFLFSLISNSWATSCMLNTPSTPTCTGTNVGTLNANTVAGAGPLNCVDDVPVGGRINGDAICSNFYGRDDNVGGVNASYGCLYQVAGAKGDIGQSYHTDTPNYDASQLLCKLPA